MWTTFRMLAIAAALFGMGCSNKDKSAKYMNSKDHHSPASEERFAMAQHLEAAGDLEMAKQLYAMVVADYPDHPVATRRLEAVLIATGEWNIHAPRTPPRFNVVERSTLQVASIESRSEVAVKTQLAPTTRTDPTPTGLDRGYVGIALASSGPEAPLGEIEASLREFEQSESATLTQRNVPSISATVSMATPAELSGHIEFAN
ncbi:MAG: hypothetical protein O3A00_14150 [Planctomycetota bacterium]|nr:hypothetical protein [Planctomycetota bacterium]